MEFLLGSLAAKKHEEPFTYTNHTVVCSLDWLAIFFNLILPSINLLLTFNLILLFY